MLPTINDTLLLSIQHAFLMKEQSSILYEVTILHIATWVTIPF